MNRKVSSRQLAIDKASQLFQRQGYHGTGLNQIIDESGSPKGSFYHHFPGGKEELALESINWMGRLTARMFKDACDGCSSEGVYIKRIVRAIEEWLDSSAFTEGCPVAGFAVEGVQYEAIRTACNQTYTLWCEQVATALRDFGYSSRAGKDRAVLIVSTLDGAVLMSRVARNAEPLRGAGRALTATATR